jgi:hypothetical protein
MEEKFPNNIIYKTLNISDSLVENLEIHLGKLYQLL